MVRISTAVQNALLGGSQNLRQIMNFGVIELYSGDAPESADFAPSGTLLARVTRDGEPFTPGFNAHTLTLIHIPALNSLTRNPQQQWVVTPIESGTVGWWRWRNFAPDPGDFSTTHVRVDGDYGEPFSGLSLVDPNLVVGNTQTIEVFQLTF